MESLGSGLVLGVWKYSCQPGRWLYGCVREEFGGGVRRLKNSVAMLVVARVFTSVGFVVTAPVVVMHPRMPL